MTFDSPRRRVVILGTLLTMLVGCGPAAGLAPVSGVVTIDGKPYPGGKVVFSPTAKEGETVAGQSSFGRPGADGRFTLSTFAPGDGALIGTHTVSLFRESDESKLPPELAKLEFNRVTLPTGPITVKAGENEITLALTSAEIKKFGNRL